MKSINPANNQLIKEYQEHTPQEAVAILERVASSQKDWTRKGVAARAQLVKQVAVHLREHIDEYALLNTEEMGKLLTDAKAEIEKCAWLCDYYAERAENMLSAEIIATEAKKSFVRFDPLGVILGVMPWNFPFWQVFRFAVPALLAGNGAVLKHASNVPGCALACERIFAESGFPENIFRALLLPASQVEPIVRHPLVAGAAVTGSDTAGRAVAAVAGDVIKPTVLELGGSDPFIVLSDADLDMAVNGAFSSRLKNMGQTCNSAKRFIVAESIVNVFIEHLCSLCKDLKVGDPRQVDTQIGPLARPDLIDALEIQVRDSLKAGARLVCGGKRIERAGNFYEPTILTEVRTNMPVWQEETFGPVFTIMSFREEDEAVRLANDSRYGLGASIWTKNLEKGERLSAQIQAGCIFVNGLVKSDVRLPFGGIKFSGYGRELSHYGIREFVNVKTVVVG